jgi:hypothetical protein
VTSFSDSLQRRVAAGEARDALALDHLESVAIGQLDDERALSILLRSADARTLLPRLSEALAYGTRDPENPRPVAASTSGEQPAFFAMVPIDVILALPGDLLRLYSYLDYNSWRRRTAVNFARIGDELNRQRRFVRRDCDQLVRRGFVALLDGNGADLPPGVNGRKVKGFELLHNPARNTYGSAVDLSRPRPRDQGRGRRPGRAERAFVAR